jgi:hypothetical protein
MDAPTNRTTAPESPIRCELPLSELAARTDLETYADRWVVQAENARTLPTAAFNASL